MRSSPAPEPQTVTAASAPKPPAWLVHLALLASAILFGAGYVATKVIVSHVPPGAWALTRIAATAGLLWLMFGQHVRAAALAWPAKRWLLVCAVFGVVINQALFAFGMRLTTPSHAVLINGMIPFVTLLLASRLHGERLTGNKLAGFALAVMGLAYLLELDHTGWDSRTLIGDLLNLGNSVSYAVYLVLSRAAFRRFGWRAAITMVFLWGVPLIAPIGAPAALAFAWSDVQLWLWGLMVFLIVGPTIGGYVANAWALETADSSQVAAYVYLQPIMAISLANLFLDDPVTSRLLASAGMIFAGLALALVWPAWQAHRQRKAG